MTVDIIEKKKKWYSLLIYFIIFIKKYSEYLLVKCSGHFGIIFEKKKKN